MTKFPTLSVKWNIIYMLPRVTTRDPFLRVFQYKILNNTQILNKKLYQSKLSNTPLCSFCKTHDEDSLHVFSECVHAIRLWDALTITLSDYISLPNISPQSAILGFLNIEIHSLAINHILLIYKQFIYRSRTSGVLISGKLLESIDKIIK